MKSDTIITLLLSILAIVFGIVNARAKKRKLESRMPPYPDEDMITLPEERPQFQLSRPCILQEDLPEEAIRTTEPVMNPSTLPGKRESKTAPTSTRKYGFNPKQAILFSEILKPKFDEFV
ncbi:MAG TPA: hypothetical protein PKV47_04650 [Bacteroidales bacterium]|nr:hypothetical protein [Bacteroidales bacterium]